MISLPYGQKSYQSLLPHPNQRFLRGSPKSIATASSKQACNNELAWLVEVAAVSPLPKNQQIFGDSDRIIVGRRKYKTIPIRSSFAWAQGMYEEYC